MTIKRSTNFVDVIENTIGRPLLKKELIKNPLGFTELESLSEALNDFNKEYKLPIKKETDLRPSISPRLKITDNLGFNYVSRIHDFSQYEGVFTGELKKYLLYCHGLVIEDPLVYLLDYFRPGCTNSPYALARLPVINSLLLEYSEISDLIKSEIIFPVSESRYCENEVPYPDDDLLKEISKRLIFKINNLPQLVGFVFREQFRKQIFDNNIDSFYPGLEYVSVLKEIMKIRQEKFTSDEIIAPFGVSVIGSVSLLNLERISIEDICYMRKQEELFSEWRGFLNSTFKRLYDDSYNYTNLESEFLIGSQNEFLKLEKRMNSKLSKGFSNYSLMNTGRDISIGAVSGALSGMVTGDLKTTLFMTLFTGMLSGGVQPSVEAVIDLVKNKSRRKENKVIRNHFLALDLPS
ncbi:hypothetical protein OHK33_19350 [Pectobacterium aroidearum]|uniref:hypothetical protein n=1 Tax=Pectobacterium aroidearum TaxID=1201031 RepID=UPI003306BA2F